MGLGLTTWQETSQLLQGAAALLIADDLEAVALRV